MTMIPAELDGCEKVIREKLAYCEQTVQKLRMVQQNILLGELHINLILDALTMALAVAEQELDHGAEAMHAVEEVRRQEKKRIARKQLLKKQHSLYAVTFENQQMTLPC